VAISSRRWIKIVVAMCGGTGYYWLSSPWREIVVAMCGGTAYYDYYRFTPGAKYVIFRI
jgi:hypothetical protein